MPKPVLKIAEPREPYNTKEDLLELAQAYKEAKETTERNLWELSDLAHEAAEKYSLKEFAKATGENYNSLIAYSAMAGVYPKTIRGYSLTYKHYMVAKSSDKRLEWLELAEKNAWSAERLRREMNPPKEKSESKGKFTITPVTPTTEINQAGEVAYIQQPEPEVYRPSYDDIFDSLNTWAATEDGVKFLIEHGKNIFTMLRAL